MKSSYFNGVLCLVVAALQFPGTVVTFSLPGFSWGWGGANYTKLVTSPDIIQQYALAYPFQQCSFGMEGVMTKLTVTPCIDNGGRCVLTHGDNVTLDLEFSSNIPAEALVGSLSAVVTKWLTPLSLGEPEDLCKSDFISCPIQPFVSYRYRTSIFIRPSIPLLSPDIRIIIKGNHNRNIACGIVPVSITGLERDLSGEKEMEFPPNFKFYF